MIKLGKTLCILFFATASLWIHLGCGGDSTPANCPPSILASPQNATVTAGTSATFTVKAGGTAPLRYQWYKNGSPVDGAASSDYRTPLTTTADSQSTFAVTVSNDYGSATSGSAVLTVNPSSTVSIAVQPAAQKVTTGSTATFWVSATASGPVSYQWKKDGNAIAGAGSARYTTPVTTASDDGGMFSVTISSGDAVVESDAAALSLDARIDDLMAKAGGRSWSASTPMGKHYQGLHITNDEDRAYLSDASKQPPVPTGLASSLHLAAFPVLLFPSGSPSPSDINQHNVGDCNGLSAMACMAYQFPDFVKGLITDFGDGVFDVAMFDPQGLPLTVKVDSQFLADAGGKLVAVTAKSGKADWATVLEKAIMKYNVVFGADSTIEGIGSENVTPLFTGAGNSFSFSRGALTPEEITRVIEASLACGKFITGGFGSVLTLDTIQSVTGHGYACYWPADSSTMLSMRNPWGLNPKASGGYDASADGLLNIPSTTTWASTIDLRVIDSGVAGSRGRTTPYAPTAAQSVMESIHLAPELALSGR